MHENKKMDLSKDNFMGDRTFELYSIEMNVMGNSKMGRWRTPNIYYLGVFFMFF